MSIFSRRHRRESEQAWRKYDYPRRNSMLAMQCKTVADQSKSSYVSLEMMAIDKVMQSKLGNFGNNGQRKCSLAFDMTVS
jgi:hypothetical protein